MRVEGVACVASIACAAFALAAAPVQVVTTLDEIADKTTVIDLEVKSPAFAFSPYADQALLSLGDVNGDGKEDISFVRSWGLEGEEMTAYILLGAPVLPRKLAASGWSEWGIRLHGASGGRPPWPAAGLGDVNGDGYEDLAVGDMAKTWIYFNPLGTLDPREAFVRGDANQDGRIDIADAISTLSYLFGGAGRLLPCADAADANDDEALNIADAIRILGALFGGQGQLPPPNACGYDPAGEFLDCRESACQ